MSRVRNSLQRLLGGKHHVETRDMMLRDAGHGYDAFGANRDWVGIGLELTDFLHDRYFRVTASGQENLPSSGAAIVVANHSGTLPFDAMMLWANILRSTHPARLPRAIADYFVPKLPFASTLFARVGVVGGSRDNARSLLERQEMLMIFPEGVAGIGKPFRERYQLQRWTWGHAELALRHRAPIIPCAIIGAEEQMPQLAKLPAIRSFGIPYLPIPASLLPLPVHYYIHYGKPIALHEQFECSQADDPTIVAKAANMIKDAVQSLVDQGVASRPGIFV